MTELEQRLLENLAAFTGFARSRLGDPDLAADAVQESLVKALSSEKQPPASEADRWFYRILRRTIIDLYRRNEVRARLVERFRSDLEEAPDTEEQGVLCGCFQRLIPELSSADAELIQRIDLQGEKIVEIARESGTTANALGVRLHRARKRLRQLLEATCRVCAKHGCLDCTCRTAL
ncbi:MAG: RNA polymerase sigma factor [Chthoniobacterales bacterium]|nr:RNA polymerase sigma factor [Chthoniobacterales bacterium]